MRRWLLPLIVCPKTGKQLNLVDVVDELDDDVFSGTLATEDGIRYPIRGGVPRFVGEHYATAFGLQWNRHSSTQIDSLKHKHSESRFWGETGFSPEQIHRRTVLDGGCGAGRFTDVAARAGAYVVGVDLSEAVDACYANHRFNKNVCVVQGSLLQLPFRPQSFDFAFTIGVIQHTPDPLGALRQVGASVKVGGEVGVSWYKKYWYTYLHQKYLLRPIFQRMDEQHLYRFVSWYVPKLLPLSRLMAHLVSDGEILDRILPVANRDNVPGLSKDDQLEWSILDTYDWYQPRYDLPQTWRAVEGVMKQLGYRCDRAPLRRRGLHCTRLSETPFLN